MVIYSTFEDYREEHMLTRLQEELPDYDIVVEYMPTGNCAAKLKAVQDVFAVLVNTLVYEDKEQFSPELIFKDQVISVPTTSRCKRPGCLKNGNTD